MSGLHDRQIGITGVFQAGASVFNAVTAHHRTEPYSRHIPAERQSVYRRRGVASALTSRLALEVFDRGKLPFYCAAWCNLKSVRNALKCGFRPAWVELTARDFSHVESLNRR